MGPWTNPILKVLYASLVMCLLIGQGEAEEDDDDFFMPIPSGSGLSIPPSGSGSSEPQRVAYRTVCVRTCDGYFFPLSLSVGRHYANEMCQALCPAAVTKAYSMSMSGTINQATSLSGQPYSAMINAGAYEKIHDPNCACRAHGESWEKALKPAEALLGPPLPSDIFVTAENEKSIALLVSGQKQIKAKKSAVSSEDDDQETTKDIVTAGSQSSGVGPNITREYPIQRLPQALPQATAQTSPRMIAPHIIPVPARSN